MLMMTRRFAMGALLIGIVALAADTGAAPPRDAIVVGLLAEPVTMDPPQVTDLNSTRVIKRMFEGLTAQELGSYKIVPGLAERWDISKDGLLYTFHLRPNVRFHDGTPLTAEAVKFCFDRQLNEQGPFYKTGTYPYVRGFLGNVAGVEVVNPSTVQIRLKSPLTPFLQYLAHHSLYVYSPEALKKWGKDMVKNPVGTGPFKLETWEPGVRVVLARNDHYWGGAPKVRQAIYVPIIEAQARLSAIKTGEIDLTMDVPPDSLDDLRKDPNIVVAETNSSAVWYVVLNTRHAVLKDRRVRQALNYAVNKEAIIRDILKGTAIVAVSPLSPVYGPYAEPGVQRYPYDPEKAKALLREAGYANGFDVTFFVPESGSGMQSPVEMGTVIQANLAAVGVRAKIQTMEWGEVSRRAGHGGDVVEPLHRRPRPHDVHAALLRPLSPGLQRGLLPEPARGRTAAQGADHHRREGAHPALPRGPEARDRGRALDHRGPRQAGDRAEETRPGLQAPSELRHRADAGLAPVGEPQSGRAQDRG
jgi:peptide/nickel transport system substrate-binding protein